MGGQYECQIYGLYPSILILLDKIPESGKVFQGRDRCDQTNS